MRTVTFGELMLRLAAPGFERFLQTPRFNATFGGGEANVAMMLASLGLDAAFVTVLPENNPIADASGSYAASASIRPKSFAGTAGWESTIWRPARTSGRPG